MKDDILLQPRFLLEIVLLAVVVIDARLTFPDLVQRAQILVLIVSFAWAVYLVNTLLLGGVLSQLAIRPRNLFGLVGIPFHGFLHGDAGHLVRNTESFFLLGGRLILLRGIQDFTIVSLVALFVGGLGVWLFARDESHVGASGVIFGYFGFLLLRGYFERNALSAILSILMIALYSTTLWGVLPSEDQKISWEGHFFGFAGGAIAASFLEALRPILPQIRLF